MVKSHDFEFVHFRPRFFQIWPTFHSNYFKVGVNGSIYVENFWIIFLMFLLNKNEGRFQECLL